MNYKDIRNICIQYMLSVSSTLLAVTFPAASALARSFLTSFVYQQTTEKKSLQKVYQIMRDISYFSDPLSANGPLNVFFKLPITEVTSVDDHRRVRISFRKI